MARDADLDLPLTPPFPPMEARQVAAIPRDEGWLFEPKWDGFRCIAFRDVDAVHLQSKAGKPLTRYFPDVVDHLRSLRARRFVLDGEIVVPVGGTLSFDELLQRIHPAASRVDRLAAERPALFLAFDLLVTERRTPLVDMPLRERRRRLEAFAERYFDPEEDAGVRLSPATEELAAADRWLADARTGLDGVMAKRLDEPYRTGEREGMVKVKRLRSADCVVGGFRYGTSGTALGSLLLGLYDRAGLLHHVGFCSSLTADRKRRILPELEKRRGGAGFTGRAPGGPSRWNQGQEKAWFPLRPELVVEVQYDHFSEGRFRHGTRFVRLRPDKVPRQCTLDQVERDAGSSLALL
jgi:ATP-dependent DNA ligase